MGLSPLWTLQGPLPGPDLCSHDSWAGTEGCPGGDACTSPEAPLLPVWIGSWNLETTNRWKITPSALRLPPPAS